jgi:hypothetical protein
MVLMSVQDQTVKDMTTLMQAHRRLVALVALSMVVMPSAESLALLG